MKILANGCWKSGYLDYTRGPDEHRIKVLAMLNLRALSELNVIRPKRPSIILNYLRELGIRGVLLKVRSRLAEAARNDKQVSCGIGEVMEAPFDSPFLPGTRVVFVAPAHPPAAERLCLPTCLLINTDAAPEAGGNSLLHAVARSTQDWCEAIAGWSPHSGKSLAEGTTPQTMRKAKEFVERFPWPSARALPREDGPVRTSTGGEHTELDTVLFGYGNYAKTVIIPSARPHLHISRVHEIDPTQIGAPPGPDWHWSTSPGSDGANPPRAVFVAGFHHHHADLAIEALRRGAYAAVEKPLVTNRAQLLRLEEALGGRRRLFGCFHKRYSRLNALARHDLSVSAGQPIHYHCIVYEIPTPRLHWYRWPNSCSRIVSNGCHWTDHFLFLNDYAQPVRQDVYRAHDGSLSVCVELENGAVFTMALTEHGSERLGVRDHVELRAGSITVTMTDSTRYKAENSSRVLRRARISRYSPYQAMYREIGQKIVMSEPADSVRSVLLTSRLMLDLEETLISARAKS